MELSENICPICKEKNELEAVVCKNCGSALDVLSTDAGTRTKTTNVPMSASESVRDWSIDEAAVQKNGIAIYIEGEFEPIHIDQSGEFVIGRKSGTTAKVSEGLLDLAPLGGYSRGVSRRHVFIKRTEQGYEVLDLGSVNGSWLNGQRLVPHKQYPLDSRSHLRLGSMRLFVIYRPIEKAQPES